MTINNINNINNLNKFNIIILFGISILIAIYNIPLLYIILFGIYLLINDIYIKNNYELLIITNRVPTAIPIAKVIWTKYWEEESKKFILQYNSNFNLESSILFNIQMTYYIDSWDELHVKSLNNSDEVLNNYNLIEPVIGTLIS